MTLVNMRGLRALATMLAWAGLASSPAIADAAAKKKHVPKKSPAALKEAKSKRPTGTVKALSKTPSGVGTSGLGNTLGLGSTTQLAAMNTALSAASDYFAGRSTGCKSVTPMLASRVGMIMPATSAMPTATATCGLNLQQSSMLTGSEICKTTPHEFGHRTGLRHSADGDDVMFAPFQADPIPAPCVAQPLPAVVKAPAKVAPGS